METARELTAQVLREAETETGVYLHVLIGTMIEVLRGALTAGAIARSAEFFSFGTNNLTQMTWASPAMTSRPRSSGKYLQLGIFGVSPFETIDREASANSWRSRSGPAGRPGRAS